jgi:tetratricopeptide (TPR) repeat protein
MLLIPLLAMGALEIALRLAGYGYSTRLFKPLRIGNEQFLVENEKFSLRFFPPELMRTPGPIRMKPTKPPGTYRIFVLGESAAMGDPEPGFAASRYLEVLLRERFPEAKFEVINVAFTAINSHVILPIARECASREGDLWIIYMGNNEMVGPFGAATVFGPKAPPLALVRMSLAIQQSRLGQLLSSLADRLKPKSAKPASWGGMQMFLGNQVPPNSPQRETVYRNFQKNLEDILSVGRKAGVRILLNTVAVNLKDCPPFSSNSATNLPPSDRTAFEHDLRAGQTLEAQTNYAAATERFARAAKSHPQSAEAQFGWGQCLLQLKNLAAAAEHFQAACDLDTLPFRTDSQINGSIRDAARKAANSCLLFDAASWLATNSPHGIVGQEMLYEHVHLNFDGKYLLARGWAEQFRSLLPEALARRAAPDWPARDVCERQLGLTDWNRAIVVEGMLRRMRQPPLNSQSNNSRRIAALQSWVNELRRGMNPASAASAHEAYLETIRRMPEDYCVRENFASFLVANGDLPGAADQWQQVHELIPQDYLANFRWGELLARLGKTAEAQTVLSRAAELRPFLSDPWCELGKIYLAEGKLELALAKFTRACELQPNNAEYHYQVGRALVLQKRVDEGIERLRRAIRYDPDHWQARDALGGQLGLAGQLEEAKIEFEAVTRLQPGYARGHLNLGVALLKTSQPAAAALAFEQAVRLEPTNSIAQDYLRQAKAAASVPR